MKANNPFTKILTDETLRETVAHGSEEYPFQFYLEDFWLFDFHCIDWHWHPEVEFVFAKKGSVTVLIGSDRFTLEQGTGIFINSQVIHRFEVTENTITPNIVFAPHLLSPKESLIYQKYIQPVLSSSSEYQIFSEEIPWQKDILHLLQSVFALQEAENVSEMMTVHYLLQLWEILWEHIHPCETVSLSNSSARTRAQLQIMMQYIHNNYSTQVTLNDLASTVMLSKSSVLNIFQQYLHISPINYLIHYRLKSAAKLLSNTENSISSIAQSTGFEDTGYFCRKFKSLFGQTPGEYRKKGGSHEL